MGREGHNNMRICSLYELKNKEVVNITDGCRLGFVSDAEIDLDSGRVISLLIPSEGKLFSLGKCTPIRVLWCDIEKIGGDIILVRRAEAIPQKCKDGGCESCK